MKDFAAIDFETANRNGSSICSVGIVIVRDGKVENKIYELVYPVPNYYSAGNVRVHGLTAEDTNEAEKFPFVWAGIHPEIADLPLVAHFSRFDEGCLKAAFRYFGMEYPDYKFYCSCLESRRMLKNRLPNYRLPTVAAYCGYDLRKHHHALADAEAAAHIWYYLTEGKRLFE